MKRLLIVAASARALAQSARKAGFEVVAVDAFGDLDLKEAALASRRCRWSPRELLGAILELCRTFPPEAWLYGGGVERFPELVARIDRRVKGLGNPAATLRKLSPPRLFSLLDRCRIFYPEISRRGRWPRWLYKLPASGGTGVLRCQAKKGGIWQRRLAGRVYSLIFLAEGGRLLWSAPFLLESRSLRDRPALFEALSGPVALPFAPACQARVFACRLAASLRLRGWNSLDLILHRGRFFLIDLNPRPGAAVNLLDQLLPEGAVAALFRPPRGAQGERCYRSPRGAQGEKGEKCLYGVVLAPRRLELCRPLPAEAVDLPEKPVFRRGEPMVGLLLRGKRLPELWERFLCLRREVLK